MHATFNAHFRIVFIVNQNAGKGTSREGMGMRLAAQLRRLPCIVEVYQTATLQEVPVVIRKILARGMPDVFVYCGGDGTVHETMTSLLCACAGIADERLPSILYLPTGTVRVFASSLGLVEKDPEELVEGFINGLLAGGPMASEHVNMLRINGKYGSVWGAGIPVNFLNQYYAGEHLGPAGAGRVLFETLKSEVLNALSLSDEDNPLVKPVHGTVRLPEGHDPPVVPFATHTALMASSVEEIGYGCKGMPLARSERGKFMVRSTQLSLNELFGLSGALWLGQTPLPKTFDAVVSRIEIDWATPTVTTIDGEMKPPEEKTVIKIGPELEILTP